MDLHDLLPVLTADGRLDPVHAGTEGAVEQAAHRADAAVSA